MKKTYLLLILILPLLFCGCSSDDGEETAKASDITLSINDVQSVDKSAYQSVEVENDFIASYSNGQITAKHVGKTLAKTKGNQTFTITVKSKITSIYDLCMDWGTPKSVLVTLPEMSGYEEDNVDGTMILSTINSDKDIQYQYHLENGVLTTTGIYIYKSRLNELLAYLRERFYMIDGQNIRSWLMSTGLDAYEPAKAKTICAVRQYGDYYMAMFMPYTKN